MDNENDLIGNDNRDCQALEKYILKLYDSTTERNILLFEYR